jgi:hypothetical protein
LDKIIILIEGFRLLSQNERWINGGSLDDDARSFGINCVGSFLFRWKGRVSLTEQDICIVKNYFGLFLEALYLYQRHKKARRKEASELEKIFLKFVPYKLEA